MPCIITSPDELPAHLSESVSVEERELIQRINKTGLPFSVTRHFASLAKPEACDPIRRQFMPSPLELTDDPFALDDPLGEDHFLAAPRLVHQYRDRALLLAGGTCAGFCRYCFRRKRMPAAFITEEELKPVLGYLQAQSGIREILVSGGDPLTAADAELEWLFEEIRKARPGILIRICSRIPITNPGRINALAAALFARYMPLRLVTHINHPRELAPEARAALAHLVKTGIPVHVQTVLLRGINDNAETLAELFWECLNLGISPYYLFQLDLAPGTAHFRVPLKEGISIYRELKTLISGLGLPTYAVDLPGGGGKIRLHENVISGDDLSAGAYLLAGQDGKLWKYPVD